LYPRLYLGIKQFKGSTIQQDSQYKREDEHLEKQKDANLQDGDCTVKNDRKLDLDDVVILLHLFCSCLYVVIKDPGVAIMTFSHEILSDTTETCIFMCRRILLIDILPKRGVQQNEAAPREDNSCNDKVTQNEL